MPKKKRLTAEPNSMDWDMTPMIDIVFLLMIFFVLTFKIVAQEGNFSVRVPMTGAATESLSMDIPAEPFRVKLHADSEGDLASIVMGERPLGTNYETLRQQVMAYVGSLAPDARKELEAELTCDYNLKYEYTVRAMTAISGYIEENQIVPLIEKIKFAN